MGVTRATHSSSAAEKFRSDYHFYWLGSFIQSTCTATKYSILAQVARTSFKNPISCIFRSETDCVKVECELSRKSMRQILADNN